MNRNRLYTRIDRVLCAIFVICIVMMGFCVGCGEWLVAVSFAMNLVCVVLLAVTRDETRDED